MEHSNGHIRDDISTIRKDVSEMKDDLASAVKDLHVSIHDLTQSITRLTDRWDVFSNSILNSIPIRAVMAMFGILVLALVGVQGAEWLFKSYLGGIHP